MPQDPAKDDSSLIGSVINALPIDKMIATPLMAMIKAQVQASKAYADFLLSVCIKDGKAVAVEFTYDESVVDEKGVSQGYRQRKMTVPLLAAISHPNICINEGSVDFELEISSIHEDKSSTDVGVDATASIGWGPFSLKVTAKVSHHKEQTRKTDTRAKYSIHTAIKREGPPESLMRVIDFITDASTKPVVEKGKEKPTDKPEGTESIKKTDDLNKKGGGDHKPDDHPDQPPAE